MSYAIRATTFTSSTNAGTDRVRVIHSLLSYGLWWRVQSCLVLLAGCRAQLPGGSIRAAQPKGGSNILRWLSTAPASTQRAGGAGGGPTKRHTCTRSRGAGRVVHARGRRAHHVRQRIVHRVVDPAVGEDGVVVAHDHPAGVKGLLQVRRVLGRQAKLVGAGEVGVGAGNHAEVVDDDQGPPWSTARRRR